MNGNFHWKEWVPNFNYIGTLFFWGVSGRFFRTFDLLSVFSGNFPPLLKTTNHFWVRSRNFGSCHVGLVLGPFESASTKSPPGLLKRWCWNFWTHPVVVAWVPLARTRRWLARLKIIAPLGVPSREWSHLTPTRSGTFENDLGGIFWSFCLEGIIAILLVESIILQVTKTVLPKVDPSLTQKPPNRRLWTLQARGPEVWTCAIWMLISLSPVLTSATWSGNFSRPRSECGSPNKKKSNGTQDPHPVGWHTNQPKKMWCRKLHKLFSKMTFVKSGGEK